MVDRENLIKEIKTLSDSIRKKHRNLKQGVIERERFLETTFEPVINPLKDISKGLKNQSSSTSNGIGVLEDDGKKVARLSGGEGEEEEEEGNGEEEEEDEETNSDVSEEELSLEGEGDSLINNEKSQKLRDLKASHRLSILGEDIGSKGVLTRKYIFKMLHATPGNRKYHVYGARLENQGLMIGDSLLVTDEEDNLIIKGKTYKGSPGLFELVFRPNPLKYTTRDLNMFKIILKQTNAHKKNYSSSSEIHRNTSKKYMSIIKSLFPPKQAGKSSGKGILLKNTYDTNVIYYNNVNKLVDRMRLLYEAKQSGHTGVDNELIALTEEMRNRGYII